VGEKGVIQRDTRRQWKQAGGGGVAGECVYVQRGKEGTLWVIQFYIEKVVLEVAHSMKGKDLTFSTSSALSPLALGTTPPTHTHTHTHRPSTAMSATAFPLRVGDRVLVSDHASVVETTPLNIPLDNFSPWLEEAQGRLCLGQHQAGSGVGVKRTGGTTSSRSNKQQEQ
jgi:hypothetical protein